ncbi:MAG: phospholipase [Caldilineae bacterium]|nr:phospholipase [Caldilineae bacterium]
MRTPGSGTHADQPLVRAGPPPGAARAGLILLHGRGGHAADILALHRLLERDDVAALAPQAAGFSWYPDGFLAPWTVNAAGRDSGVSVIDGLVAALLAEGLPADRILIAGFSQGACLACDFLLRHPRRYGGLAALTGGLGGPPGSDWAAWLREDRPLSGMPAYLASGDPDPHVPWPRVAETAAVLEGLGARVALHRLPGQGHQIGPASLDGLRALVRQVAEAPPPAG